MLQDAFRINSLNNYSINIIQTKGAKFIVFLSYKIIDLVPTKFPYFSSGPLIMSILNTIPHCANFLIFFFLILENINNLKVLNFLNFWADVRV